MIFTIGYSLHLASSNTDEDLRMSGQRIPIIYKFEPDYTKSYKPGDVLLCVHEAYEMCTTDEKARLKLYIYVRTSRDTVACVSKRERDYEVYFKWTNVKIADKYDLATFNYG